MSGSLQLLSLLLKIIHKFNKIFSLFNGYLAPSTRWVHAFQWDWEKVHLNRIKCSLLSVALVRAEKYSELSKWTVSQTSRLASFSLCLSQPYNCVFIETPNGKMGSLRLNTIFPHKKKRESVFRRWGNNFHNFHIFIPPFLWLVFLVTM